MKTLLIALFAGAAIAPVSARAQQVQSRYGDIYPESVANYPSPSPNLTLLEQRDNGIDLFIAGMILNAVVGPLIPVAVAPTLDLAAITIGAIAGAGITTAGLVMWIAGAVYWGAGNAALTQRLLISDNANNARLSLRATANGIAVNIAY